jgi:hypothetical protein
MVKIYTKKNNNKRREIQKMGNWEENVEWKALETEKKMLNEKFLKVLPKNHKKLESWKTKMESHKKLKEQKLRATRNLLNKKLCEVDIPRKRK